jgi:hypothetical protein
MSFLSIMGLMRCPGTILPMHDYCYVEGMPACSISTLRSVPDNCYILAHVPARSSQDGSDEPGRMLNGFKVVTVYRDPRNVLVSYIRHRKRVEGLNVSIAEALSNFWGTPFVGLYKGFLAWHGRSVVVRYEDLPASVVGHGDRIYAGHAEDFNTRTGCPSRWQSRWNQEAEAAWVSHGGPELLREAGYV